MSTILYENQFMRLESSIHESTHEVFMHMALMEMRIDHGMARLETRKREMIKAGEEMQSAYENHAELEEVEQPCNHDFDPLPKMEPPRVILDLILQTIRRLEACSVFRCIGVLVCAALIAPAAAMEDQLAIGRAFSITEAMDPHQVPTIAIGTCTGMLFLCGGYVLGAAKTSVAPLMGITSVLWFMLRNDAAVSPGLAWA
ncbi:hypothetical protein N0V90_012320 [Kalmusia sp. IMI 367209]|nr:hypothetical protein N0V90_012320 [Kalmusia sp. IMI 367209]